MTVRAMDVCGILLATDGSPGADAALRLVASSFAPGTAAVEVLSVVPTFPRSSDAAGDLSELVALHRRQAAQQVAEEASERLAAQGFEAHAVVRAGHPAEVIVELAAACRPHLVVLGTRGLSSVRRRQAGSVSMKVARYAPVSVLVARTPGPVRRLLIGYDASPDADEALAQVGALPWRGAVDVTVVSAFDVPRYPLLSGSATSLMAEIRVAHRDASRWAREAAEVMATDAARRLTEEGLCATVQIARGRADRRLAIVATELAADLLVVGSRGLSAIQRFLLGSTSAALLTHPPTSVLVVRDGGDRTRSCASSSG